MPARLIDERGKEDWDSELGRFPRLFQAAESVPGLTWPTLTFSNKMTVYLGKRRIELMHLGRAHTAGDIVAWVPDASAMFSGDIVEYRSACYCGDAHFADWPATLDAIAAFRPKALAPGRGDALVGENKVAEAIALTRDFLTSVYRPVAEVAARGGSLKEAMAACRALCDEKFSTYAIYEHCLPFNSFRVPVHGAAGEQRAFLAVSNSADGAALRAIPQGAVSGHWLSAPYTGWEVPPADAVVSDPGARRGFDLPDRRSDHHLWGRRTPDGRRRQPRICDHPVDA